MAKMMPFKLLANLLHSQFTGPGTGTEDILICHSTVMAVFHCLATPTAPPMSDQVDNVDWQLSCFFLEETRPSYVR